MFLLVLAACSTDELAAYAGCTVTTASTDHERGESTTLVEVYDREAHVVESREENAGHVEVRTATYDGDCLSEQVEELTFGSESEVTTTHRDCDEHAHVLREERETSSNGGAPVAGRTYAYTNTHDDEGRLVEVEMTDEWAGETWVTTFEWAEPCTEPAASRSVDPDGDVSTASTRCRSDGRGESGEYAYLDDRGTQERVLRWSRTFDTVGRMLTESWDDSPEREIVGTFTNTWGDVLAPGPTQQVLHTGVNDDLALTSTYTYACGL